MTRRINGRHIDGRRRLTPRGYLADPYRFGQPGDAVFVVPSGGDQISAQVARVQHELIVLWRSRGKRPPASEILRRWGVSSSTWSRVVLGERWAGETLLAALHDTLCDTSHVSFPSNQPAP